MRQVTHGYVVELRDKPGGRCEYVGLTDVLRTELDGTQRLAKVAQVVPVIQGAAVFGRNEADAWHRAFKDREPKTKRVTTIVEDVGVSVVRITPTTYHMLDGDDCVAVIYEHEDGIDRFLGWKFRLLGCDSTGEAYNDLPTATKECEHALRAHWGNS